MRDYMKSNRARFGSVAGIFAAGALVLLAALLFNDAGSAASLLM